jgi:hypothetical protein
VPRGMAQAAPKEKEKVDEAKGQRLFPERPRYLVLQSLGRGK